MHLVQNNKLLKISSDSLSLLVNKVNHSQIKSSADEKLWNLFTYDTVFTVLVTLGIFILGIVIDRVLKWFDKNQKKKELQLYFYYLLDIIIKKTCPTIIDMYSNVYKTTHINTGIYSTPPKILNDNFQRIFEIPNNELFLITNNKISFSNILNNLDHIRLMIVEVENFHNRVREDMLSQRLSLQNEVNTYIKTLANYVEHLRINDPKFTGRNEFEELIKDSIYNFYYTPKLHQKIEDVYKKIIRPIQILAVDKNIFRLDEGAKEITVQGKTISTNYRYLRRMTIEFRLQYRAVCISIIKSKKALALERNKI